LSRSIVHRAGANTCRSVSAALPCSFSVLGAVLRRGRSPHQVQTRPRFAHVSDQLRAAPSPSRRQTRPEAKHRCRSHRRKRSRSPSEQSGENTRPKRVLRSGLFVAAGPIKSPFLPSILPIPTGRVSAPESCSTELPGRSSRCTRVLIELLNDFKAYSEWPRESQCAKEIAECPTRSQFFVRPREG
jgi:hypothetical protein